MINILIISVSASSIVIESDVKNKEAVQDSWKDYFCFTYKTSTEQYRNQTIRNALIGLNFSQKQRQNNQSMFHKYKAVKVPIPSMTIQLEDEKQEKEQSSYNNYFRFNYYKKCYFPKKHKNENQKIQNALIGQHSVQRRYRDRWIHVCHETINSHLYAKMRGTIKDASSSYPDLLSTLKFLPTLWLTNRQIKEIHLKFLPDFLFIRMSDQNNLLKAMVDSTYGIRRMNFDYDMKSNLQLLQLDAQMAADLFKRIVYLYLYVPMIQRKLIKNCLQYYDVNSMHDYDFVSKDERFKKRTILTFLLLNIEIEEQKGDQKRLHLYLSLFKFFVTQSAAHLFMRDAHGDVPIVMIEDNKNLHTMIENYFGKESFKQLVEMHSSKPLRIKDHRDSSKYDLAPIIDAVVYYDLKSLKIILRSCQVDFQLSYDYHYGEFFTIKGPDRNGNYIYKNNMSLIEIALYVHQKFLLFFSRNFLTSYFQFSKDSLLSFDKELKMKNEINYIILSYLEDTDVSPYLPILWTLLEGRTKNEIRKLCVRVILDCFDAEVGMIKSDTYKIFCLILKNKDTYCFKVKKDIIKRSIENESRKEYLSNLLCQDIATIIMDYYCTYVYRYGHILPLIMEEQMSSYHEQNFMLQILSNVSPFDMDFGSSSPESNLLVNYYYVDIKLKQLTPPLNHYDQRDYDNLIKNLEKIKKYYYQLLLMNGYYEKIKGEFEKIFKNHYELFLEFIGESISKRFNSGLVTRNTFLMGKFREDTDDEDN